MDKNTRKQFHMLACVYVSHKPVLLFTHVHTYVCEYVTVYERRSSHIDISCRPYIYKTYDKYLF